jgi:hypothetical protein
MNLSYAETVLKVTTGFSMLQFIKPDDSILKSFYTFDLFKLITFMKTLLVVLLILVSSFNVQASFDEWFTNRTLRIDYYHSGNSKTEVYSIDEVISEPFWGGTQTMLRPIN